MYVGVKPVLISVVKHCGGEYVPQPSLELDVHRVGLVKLAHKHQLLNEIIIHPTYRTLVLHIFVTPA